MKINSHNEWDRLREVIVGSADKTIAVLTWNKKEPPSPQLLETAYDLARKAYPSSFLDEIKEDLNGLSDAISKFGAKVYRPTVHDITNMYASP